MTSKAPEQKLILASGSAIRAAILTGAHVPFEVIRPDVDEDAMKVTCAANGLSIDDTALALAEAKALSVAAPADRFVLGSDQIMEFDGAAFDKPKDMEAAAARLAMLQGREHFLINGAAIVKNGEVIWRNVQRSSLTVRAMTSDEIDAYLQAAGPEILTSVGAYQIENWGGRIFEKVDGQHTAILGLSLFPLLKFLREQEVIAF